MSLITRLYRRIQLARYVPSHWTLRPGTIDPRVFREVVIKNEYNLPRRLNAQDVIIDIGAHVGSFAYAVLGRGVGKVYCCEPNPTNFALLMKNLAPYADRVQCIQKAAWRSDQPKGFLHFHVPGDQRNTGAGQVCDTPSTVQVETFPFDELLEEATKGEKRIRLLKMDCEGAEWPVLFTSRLLGRVDEICGEFHLNVCPRTFAAPGVGTLSRERLHEFLVQQGFETTTTLLPKSDVSGWFSGRRTNRN